MKRRNGELCGAKLRRANKKSKITDGLNQSPLIYVKFLLVWALVLLADFIVEFRFEYFTYVWVQYVWHTERGICLPTVSLWLLFVYIEASVRLRELKNLPFHLDLCRPFAAHCIGYPVVTLGFGFKSYVSYRMRLRKQKEVAKENEFYLELIQKALPQESPPPPAPSLPQDSELIQTNGVNHCGPNHQKKSSISSTNSDKSLILSNGSANKLICEYESSNKKSISNGIDRHELQYMEHQIIKKISSLNHFDNDDNVEDIVEHNNTTNKTHMKNMTALTQSPKGTHITNLSVSSAPPVSQSHQTSNNNNNQCTSNTSSSNNISNTTTNNTSNSTKKAKNIVANNLSPVKDDHSLRLEADIKRLKADLQASRQCELDLRSQLNSIIVDDRSVKNELSQLRQDNENLQQRLHNLVTAKQHDKQTIIKLEKSLDEEKKRLKANVELQVTNEKKAKKAEEVAARAAQIAAQNRLECSDNCKAKRRELDNDLKQLQHELKLKDEQLKQSEKALRQYKNSATDAEVLMSALSAMQEKNSHLEKSLSAETRLKLDLFSALDETKRQLEMTRLILLQREKEIDELKSKIAEVMAVMPTTPNGSYGSLADNVSLVNSLLPVFGHHNSHNSHNHNHTKYLHTLTDDHNMKISNTSPLDPNASIYTPKIGAPDL
ncbi:unnamed protein product [Medioppia subpectinata]|uniref:Macoilin n=1 Tax=Medioppia subpectinata TaxID=1979941 RepID=A0A7R9Q0D0_9ACAR|nr:unnamed protein product [Medioppia subpectinata]CAG2107420.1 unnamed protein product [Medioppia subpectinata]